MSLSPSDLQSIAQIVDNRIKPLEQKMDKGFKKIEKKIDKLEEKVDYGVHFLDTDYLEVKKRVGHIEEQLNIPSPKL